MSGGIGRRIGGNIPENSIKIALNCMEIYLIGGSNPASITTPPRCFHEVLVCPIQTASVRMGFLKKESKIMNETLKAYEVNTVHLPYNICHHYLQPVWDKTERGARKQLLQMCLDQDINETDLGEPLTYVSIGTKRVSDLDKVLINGEYLTKFDIEQKKKEAEHKQMIKQMLIDNPNGYAYILKGGYYYGDNFNGYTEIRNNAGVYTMEQAVKECLSCDYRDYMRPFPLNIDAHNASINEAIEKLRKKIIFN